MKKQRIRLPRRDGLVGEWLLNGNTKDTSGNGNDWTPTNVTYSKTDMGYQTYAGNFNGSNAYVSIPHNSAFNVTSSISIQAVISTTSASEQYFFNKYDDGIYCRINNGKFGFYLSGVSSGWFESLNTYNDGKTHNVVMKWDGSTKEIWVDGKPDNSVSRSGSIATGSSALLIGSRSLSANFWFDGKIQSVRFFNRSISSDEVRDWYLEGLRALGGSSLSGLMDGLVAKFDTMDGNVLDDIVWGVAVTKNSGTAATDNLGGTRAITNPNYSWTSVSYTTWYAFENAGSGWVLTESPAGLSATGINRTTTLRDVFLFNRTLSTDEKNALGKLCQSSYILPFA